MGPHCKFVKPLEPTKIILLTDNKVTAYAINRRHAKSLDVNEGIRKIQDNFARLQLTAIYIEGEKNPADRPSRGGVGYDEELLRGTLGELNLLQNRPPNDNQPSSLSCDSIQELQPTDPDSERQSFTSTLQ